jgi:hypothetical protein
LRPAVKVHDGDVAAERGSSERFEERVSERGRDLTIPNPVPLDLVVERPAGFPQCQLPELLQLRPFGVPDSDAAESEQPALVESPTLIEEEQLHTDKDMNNFGLAGVL